jgi:GWxTD domain-containing protein
MDRRLSAGGWPAAALALLSCPLWLLAGCGPPVSYAPAPGVQSLLDGPTRWLMLPDEQKQARNLASTRDAILFTESFWDRRDPDPATPGNELARIFYERVDAADRLYSEDGGRGSMTDRGRALILLGPPPMLRSTQKRIPTWEPGKPGTRPAIQSRELAVESWIYRLSQLDPRLAALLREEEPDTEEIVLTFALEPRRTYLLDGEKYLDLAVRAFARDAGPDGPQPLSRE